MPRSFFDANVMIFLPQYGFESGPKSALRPPIFMRPLYPSPTIAIEP
ncbi:hypothetical protein J3R73_000395 [Labrys monachus]|uniref:Uncharacterized protein n=1 Tax=Labrys monachus TaxID=217067 RepID=A0ABU0F939_9HYPH|nr:hypothetical protein [Labrys monachus]